MEPNALVPTNGHAGNLLTTQEFGKVQIMKQAETAASAIAAQAEAAVRARYSLAIARPRDWDVVRQRLLHECKRPMLAEAGVYSKPQGRKFNEEKGEWEDNFIEGLSIRFAEVAMRYMGNLMPETTAIYDDDKIRIVRVALTDLEANNYFVKDIVVEKTVERSKLSRDQVPLRSRMNTRGKPVYIVPATDDEVLTKENALASKALRNHVLRILPGDLQDECRKLLDATLANKDAKDPDAARKEIADGFASLNVMPDAIKTWLGHDLSTADEAERVRLRKIYSTIKSGDATWAEIMYQREEQRAQEDSQKKESAPADADSKAPAKNLADLKKKEASKKAEAPKGIKTSVEEEDGKRRPVADMADTGPCGWTDDEQGEACDREGPKYDGHGWRCKAHTPEAK